MNFIQTIVAVLLEILGINLGPAKLKAENNEPPVADVEVDPQHPASAYEGVKLLGPATPPSWSEEWTVPEPLEIILDYITQTFKDSGRTVRWCTGKDQAGVYYAVKLSYAGNAVVSFADRDEYKSWINTYLQWYEHVQ